MKKFLFLLFYLISFCSLILYSQSQSKLFSSPAFSSEAFIPLKYTYYSKNISPPLRWNLPQGISPEAVKSFAIICDDPDAPMGTWVHWVIYNIPASFRALPSGIAKILAFKNGVRQGINDFKKIGWDGPAPPPGKPHRYFFHLYGLRENLKVSSEAILKKADLLKLMKGKLLFKTSFYGLYQR